MESKSNIDGHQHVFMMRHGDRIDKFEPHWVSTAARPWDPPLIQGGMVRAFRTGQMIRSQIHFPIHRVFVSPFLRCIQTASEVIAALSDPNSNSSDNIDKPKLKVTPAATIRATIRATMESAKSNPDDYQNILMMRHGDRIDQIEPLWLDTAARPWDPPLAQDGMVRAFQTGQMIRSQIQFPIHRIFVSPFIRCIQTASQVIAALSAVDFDPNATSSKDVVSIDKSKFKVSIEFGLSEMLNSIAIKPEIAPKDGKFDFMISELEAMFPDGMVDHSVDPVYEVMPQWEETVEGCTDRFLNLIKTLADKYPSENLLLVTHGEGVRTTFATFKDVDVYDVEYCACAELRRRVLGKDGSTKTGDFEVITSLAQCGIKYHSLSTTHQTSV